MRPPDELVEKCRAAGLRVTAPRRAIFELLAGNTEHPTAEELYRTLRRRHRGLSLATVYNTLDTLHALGEISRHHLGPGADRFDPEVRPHHHFRCDGCGRVRDGFGAVALPRLDGLEGCAVERVELALSGLCSTCSASRRRSKKKIPHEVAGA